MIGRGSERRHDRGVADRARVVSEDAPRQDRGDGGGGGRPRLSATGTAMGSIDSEWYPSCFPWRRRFRRPPGQEEGGRRGKGTRPPTTLAAAPLPSPSFNGDRGQRDREQEREEGRARQPPPARWRLAFLGLQVRRRWPSDSTQATPTAVRTAHRTEVEPDPAMMSPSPVTYIETDHHQHHDNDIGQTMFAGRSGIHLTRRRRHVLGIPAERPSAPECSSPWAVRRCAAFIGPMSRPRRPTSATASAARA